MTTMAAAGGVLAVVLRWLAPEVSEPKPLAPKVGDAAPAFQCTDDQGRLWKSSEQIGKGYVVLFFLPGDFQFCSTRQAKKYRDKMADLRARGVLVVGISGDTAGTHRLFKLVHELNFPLLADVDGKVARSFGMPRRKGPAITQVTDAKGTPLRGADGQPLHVRRETTPLRWTFVIGKDGRVIHRNLRVSPVADAQEVLEFIDSLRK